ncbi:unnamed protein product [Closterium sp. Naga37s-1]|nr:unnamed protein product [Closterium sp. Naga37s-1]
MARRDDKKRRKRDDSDSEDSDERRRRSRKSRKSRKDSDDDDSNEDASASDSDGDRGRNRKRRSRGSRKKKQGGDSSESDDSSQSRSRSRSRSRGRSKKGKKDKKERREKSKRDSRRRRRERSDSEGSESSGGSSGSDSSEGSPSRGGKKVSEEELREFLAKRAQKKALKLAKKLKPNAVSGYTNDRSAARHDCSGAGWVACTYMQSGCCNGCNLTPYLPLRAQVSVAQEDREGRAARHAGPAPTHAPLFPSRIPSSLCAMYPSIHHLFVRMFVWRKKIEKDVLRGTLDPREITLQNERKRLEARMEEIEKVKKRREERMLEKAQHDEEMAMLARERARAEFQDWEEKEDEFHFEQSRVRSEIRLREGRAKPIDVLARNLTLSGDFDIEVNEPYKIFKGLTVKEMEELKEDIKMHLEFDRNNPMHQEFWKAMMVVCNHEIAETTRRDIIDRARVRGEEPPADVLEEERGLHSAVGADVAETLAVAGSEELSRMEERIAGQMETGGAKVVEYWEAVLKKLKVFKAKARLREIHADLLRQHLALLETGGVARGEGGGEEGGEGRGGGRGGEGRGWEEEEEEVGGGAAGGGGGGSGGGGGEEREPGSFSPELLTMEEAAKEGYKEGGEGAAGGGGGGGAEGGFSPELIHTYEVDGTDVVDPEADKRELERKRAQIQADRQRSVLEASGAGGGDVSAAERALVVRAPADVAAAGDRQLSTAEKAAANKMMGQDPGDVAFGAGAEVPLETQVYWWHDKYRPRKPKYFNRVHTGYEWNKYNQTHYDHDNPPPKIVQGYKFNIFYPDLIDRSKPPSYHIDKDGSEDGETCLIRFHAGPPYEDIAFRIVNKEWEYSHKKGFKCTFERGILHVYINFKRHRYRR